MNTSDRKAFLFAGAATLCWSTVAAAFKLTLKYMHGDVLNMVFWASLVSAVSLFFVAFSQEKNLHFIHIPKQELFHSLGLGLLNPAIYYIVLFKAYDLLPGQQAQPLNYTWPIILTLLSALFLKKTLPGRAYLAVLVSFFGVIVISTQGHFSSLAFTHVSGVALSLSSSVIWASYWILNLRDTRPAHIKLFWNFATGVFFLFGFLFFTHRLHLPEIRGMIGVIWVGFFEMGFTFVLWMKALESASHPARVSNVVYLSPFISLLFLNRIVGETIHISAIAGLCLIVFGILLQSRQRFTL